MASAIDNLFTALKGRATYSENIADSKQVVKDIDNYELLDKASILLTPTAYSDARVHSVKTYTGDELVTNGTFDTDSSWIKGTGWSIEDGVATSDGVSGNSNLYQENILTIGNTYKVSVDVTRNSGEVRFYITSSPTATITSSGTYTFYGLCDRTDLDFYIKSVNFDGSIDNVSLVDVSSDFDFDRASSATRINSDGLVQDMQSITDPELVLNGDFEELGDDVITNGDFSNSTNDWQNPSYSGNNSATLSIDNGALKVEKMLI